jgi:hypothetical protein
MKEETQRKVEELQEMRVDVHLCFAPGAGRSLTDAEYKGLVDHVHAMHKKIVEDHEHVVRVYGEEFTQAAERMPWDKREDVEASDEEEQAAELERRETRQRIKDQAHENFWWVDGVDDLDDRQVDSIMFHK